MRILVLCSTFPPARAPESAHALLLCEHLAERGLQVHLVTSAAPPPTGGHAFAVHPVMPSWGWRALPTLVRHIRAIRPDVILLIYVGWIYQFHPMVTYLPALCRLLVPRARFVTQFENVQLIPDHWARRLEHVVARLPRWVGVHSILGTLLSHSCQVIVLSDRHLDQLKDVWPKVAAKSALIPAPPLMKTLPDPDGSVRARGRAQLRVRPDELLLVYYGYLYPSKGIETLLEAFAILQHDRPLIRVALIGGVAGGNYAEELRSLGAKLGVADRIEWVGHCEPDADDGSVLIRAADMLILPFDAGVRLNNSSFAVASTHGVPIVTTAGPDLEAPFRHGENVWLCPPKDPIALAEAIRILARDTSLRDRLRVGARQLAVDVFSWDRNISATLEVMSRA